MKGALALTLLAFVACANLLAIDGPATNRCQTCVEAQCGGELAACTADSACAGREACLIGCGGDYACRSNCTTSYYIPASAQIPILDHCTATRCENDCGLACGLPGTPTGPSAAPGCAQCVVEHACSESQACSDSLECVQLLHCVATCSTPDCRTQCAVGRDAGAALAGVVVAAVGGRCAAACQVGEHWACVGNVPNPLPTAPSVTLTVTLVNAAAQGLPLPDVTVTACGALDPGCLSADVATTDDAGVAVLALPAGDTGYGGHLELTRAGLMPTLVFFADALSGRAFVNTGVFAPSVFNAVLSAQGQTLLPGRGVVALSVQDCALQPAANVVVSATGLDGFSTTVYARGTSLTADAGATDSTGIALILNAPVGQSLDVQATPVSLHAVSSAVQLFVVDGGMSLIALNPNRSGSSH